MEWSRELYTDPATTGLNSVSLSGTRVWRYENEFYTHTRPLGGGSSVGLQVSSSGQRSSHLLTSVSRTHSESTDGGGGGGGEGGGGSGLLASDIPQQFETQKLRKETMEKGIKL